MYNLIDNMTKMNSIWLYFVVVLIFFVDFGLSDLNQPAFHAHRPENPKFDQLAIMANESYSELVLTVREFESAILHQNSIELTHVKSLVQEHEHNVSAILDHVKATEENMDRFAFLDKLWTGFVRLEAEAYTRAYKRILAEIAHNERNISVRYTHSDSIDIFKSQIAYKMEPIWKALSETNNLVLDAYHNKTNSSVFAKTSKQVFKVHFDEIQQTASKSRNEIANGFNHKLEENRLTGLVYRLSIDQQTRFEVELEVFDYIGLFVKQFEQKFLELH